MKDSERREDDFRKGQTLLKIAKDWKRLHVLPGILEGKVGRVCQEGNAGVAHKDRWEEFEPEEAVGSPKQYSGGMPVSLFWFWPHAGFGEAGGKTERPDLAGRCSGNA
ncbi:MAG: hypothetical protein ACYCYP_00895 [Leptospirales bacterium]